MATLSLAMSCGGADSTNPLDGLYANYPTDFAVSVSAGTTPTFTWSGVPGRSFSVTDDDTNTLSDNDTCYFFCQSFDGIFNSPVTYGKMPPGSDCSIIEDRTICPNAKPFVKGHSYQVIIICPDSQTGTKVFRP